jgi:hypothetical protein
VFFAGAARHSISIWSGFEAIGAKPSRKYSRMAVLLHGEAVSLARRLWRTALAVFVRESGA